MDYSRLQRETPLPISYNTKSTTTHVLISLKTTLWRVEYIFDVMAKSKNIDQFKCLPQFLYWEGIIIYEIRSQVRRLKLLKIKGMYIGSPFLQANPRLTVGWSRMVGFVLSIQSWTKFHVSADAFRFEWKATSIVSWSSLKNGRVSSTYAKLSAFSWRPP